MTLQDPTPPNQVQLGSNGNEGVLPRAPELESHHQIQFNVKPRTPLSLFLWGGSYSSAVESVSVF